MLNKLILSAILSLSLAFSANAALITQDLISDTAGGIIGSITIDTVSVDEFDTVNSWVSFDFFGFEAETAYLFAAVIDTNDLYAGILSLDFDVNDSCAGCEWAYNGFAGAGFNGMVDIFDIATGDLMFFADDVVLGQATVVPTPATLVLFLTAVAGLASRRKNS